MLNVNLLHQATRGCTAGDTFESALGQTTLGLPEASRTSVTWPLLGCNCKPCWPVAGVLLDDTPGDSLLGQAKFVSAFGIAATGKASRLLVASLQKHARCNDRTGPRTSEALRKNEGKIIQQRYLIVSKQIFKTRMTSAH